MWFLILQAVQYCSLGNPDSRISGMDRTGRSDATQGTGDHATILSEDLLQRDLNS